MAGKPSTVDKVKNKVQEVVTEDTARLRDLTAQAATSGAYLYPIKGILYFISHRALWKPLLAKLVPTLSLGAGITVFMFVFTYVPQAAVMAFTNGPVAALTAGLLVLSESSTITNLLARQLLVSDALIDTFDGTLMSRGTTELVSSGREIKRGKSDPIHALGKLAKKPFAKYSPSAFIRYLIYLPLNFIPVVGSAIFIIIQGRKNGPDRHERYYQLKEWNASQREKHVDELKGAYTSFGIVATLLELVPVASILFSFTNTVGAALWASDLEKHGKSAGTTAPSLREQAEQVDKEL